MEALILSILVVGVSFLILGFNIFLRKDKRFPETEIGKNRKMRELGISCVRCDEMKSRKKIKRKLMIDKINPSELKVDIIGINTRES